MYTASAPSRPGSGNRLGESYLRPSGGTTSVWCAGSPISVIPSPPWPSRTAWTSKPSPPCWATTMPGSPSAPTPTPPGRSRTRQPRPWEPHGAGTVIPYRLNRTAHRLGSRTSLPVRCVFRAVWVTVWVKFSRRLKVRTFYIVKRPENDRFQGVSCDSDTIWIFHC